MKRNHILKIIIFIFSICLFINLKLSTNNYVSSETINTNEEIITDSGSCGTSAYWYYYEESKTLSITGSGEINSSRPWKSYNSSIEKIIVDDEITSIKEGAFQGCTNLKEIILPFVGLNRTATAEYGTFGYIFGYTTISSDYDSGLKNQYGVFTGESNTFSGNSDGNHFSDSYTAIALGYYEDHYNYGKYYPFAWGDINCDFKDYKVGMNSSDKNYNIFSQPEDTTWQYSCVNYDIGNSRYCLQSYYYYIPNKLSKVTITNANMIADAAFMNCTNILEINLNSEITSIGDYAFRNDGKISIFNLPSDLTNLGFQAMKNCDSLTDVAIPSGVTEIKDYTFYDCDNLENVKFNNEITSIGSYAFYSCKKLKDVSLPEKLLTIGDYAFAYNISFTNIIIPELVTTIGKSAFENCTNIINLHIGSAVKTIYDKAFANLSKIEIIIVPNNVNYILEGVFLGCTNLKEITLPFVGSCRSESDGYSNTFGYIFGYTTISAKYDSNLNYQHGVFIGEGNTFSGNSEKKYFSNSTTALSLGYICESSNKYYNYSRQNLSFKDYKVGMNSSYNNYTIFSQPEDTTWQFSCVSSPIGQGYYSLQSYYYYIPKTLSKVTITNAIRISAAAFMNCTNITEINLNSEIISIGDYAFRNCGLVNKSTDVMLISGDVLIKYNGTESKVNIPENIDTIAPRAFYGNTKVGTVNFSEAVTFVGDNAFYGCTNAVVNVPKISGSLTIGTDAFSGTGQVKYLDMSSYTNGNDTFYYTINSDNKAIIVKCSTTSTNITLPVTLGGYEVIKVGYRGMADCTTLTSVTIPSNIIALDLYAFYGCTNITTVTIPATCTQVGDYAFKNCTSLHSVTIAEGVTYVGDSAFYGCTSLAEIVIPDSCTYLGKYAFYNCTSLQSATIGILVPDVNKFTFYNCSSLASVVLGTSVKSIGDYAFYNTPITRVTTPTTLKSIGDYAYAECSKITKVTLRSGFETIGDGAFKNCTSLNSINIVSTIKSIGSFGFYGCSSLSSTIVPSLVTEINDYTYAYCTSLATVTVNGQITRIGNNSFFRTDLTAFNFGNVLEKIGSNAFAYNDLTTITLPNSINYIGEQAFDECTLLTNVSIPDDIAFVGAYAFPQDVSNLTFRIRYNTGKISDYLLFNTDSYKVIIGEGITEIGDYAFAFNKDLAVIEFPSTLEVVGDYAFYDNRNYDAITLPSKTKSLGDYAFARGYQLALIKLPDSIETIGSNCFYRDEDKMIHPNVTIQFYYNKGKICANILNNQLMHNIIVDDQIFSIGDYAFANASNLRTVSLPDSISSFGSDVFTGDNRISVTIRKYDGKIDNEIYKGKLLTQIDLIVNNTDIGESVFYGCTGLQTLKVNDKSDIGDYAFYGCTGLQTITINDESNIDDYAFYGCISLLDVLITDSSILGEYAFYNCNAMTTFRILGDVTTIKEHCFDSCKSLQSMILPLTVSYIGGYAFYDCNSMASINIPTGIKKILSHTFYGCSSLTSIDTPNTIDEIQDYAFYGCIAAQTINISSNCKSIGDYTFYNCKLVSSLIIPDSVQYIGDYTFRSCLKVTELKFSDNVEEIGACAFYDCNALEKIYLGKKIIELKDRLFYACVNLTDLYVYAPLSNIHELAFYGAEECIIHMGNDTYMKNRFDELGMTYQIDTSIVYSYKVSFINYDDTIISSFTYHLGDTVTIPTNPTRSADETYTYTFASWDKSVTTCSGNTTYKAIYTQTYIDYLVVFKNYDNSIIEKVKYHYGDTIVDITHPTRSADNTYSYAFKSWDKEFGTCTSNKEFIALYTPSYINYSVTFKNDDGTTLSSKTYHYGDVVVEPSTPKKDEDNTYTYVFKSWDKTVVNCAGNATYTATYTPTYIEYTIKFIDFDDAKLSTKTYHYGESVVEPATPTRASDNTYTYTFKNWNKEVTKVTCNETYEAVYTATYIDYLIVFKNDDSSIISSKAYHYGDKVTKPSNPTKASDNTYSYQFASWDKAVSTVTCNETYIATYTPIYIEYIVEFVDYDDSLISSKTYHYGDTVNAPTNPTKVADKIGTFKFKGWDSTVTNCSGNKTYKALYDISYIDYLIIFENANGNELSRKTYHYGDTIVEPKAPTKESNETYTYTFAGWGKNYTSTCKGEAIYIAQFTPTYINYTIKFVNYDNNEISSKIYHYGDTVIEPVTPKKPSNETYDYTFVGWNKVVTMVQGNETYKAIYDVTYIEYTVMFVDYNDTLISSKTYHYGDKVVIPNNPTRKADNTYSYAFKSWDKEVVNCTSNAIYNATYTSTYIDYTVIFKNYDDTLLSSNKYHYGDKVTAPTKTPTRKSDEKYDYTFDDWDKQVTNCNGNVVYTAVFKKSESNEYKSRELLIELEKMIDSIEVVDLNTFSTLVSIQEKSTELLEDDKITLNKELQTIITSYTNYVQSINAEYEVAEEVETNYFIVILEMINYISILAYAVLKGKKWFL